jgi:hypothetical protein
MSRRRRRDVGGLLVSTVRRMRRKIISTARNINKNMKEEFYKKRLIVKGMG